jgi:signal transduction histidine kinase/HAMP domain-containing protein
MKLPGKTLRSQLTLLIFGLTGIAIIVISVLGVRAVSDAGRRASNITANSTRDRAQQLLAQAASTTAAKNSVIFGSIQRTTTSAGEYTTNILLNPAQYPNTSWRFDDHVKRRPAGNWSNSASEPSSIFIQSTLPVTPAIKREIELTAYLDHLFPQMLKNEPNAVALYYDGPKGETRYYPNIELDKVAPPDYDSTTGEFFVVANPQNNPDGAFKWSKVYDDPAGHGLTITAAQPMYSPNKTFLGIIGMDISLNNIAKNIEDYSPIETSYAFLINNSGRAIALPAQGYKDLLGRDAKQDEFGADLKDVSGDMGLILGQMRDATSGFSQVRVGGETLYVAHAPVEGTEFSLGIVARERNVLQVVNQLQDEVGSSTSRVLAQIIVAASVLLALVWFSAFLFIRYTTNPIKRLTRKTVQVAGGDLEIDEQPIRADNEIGVLARSFDTMVAELRRSRHKIETQNQALLHHEQTRLNASINSLKSGFIMTNLDGEVLLVNPAAKRILSLRAKEQSTITYIAEQLGQAFDLEAAIRKSTQHGRPTLAKEVHFKSRVLHIYVAPIQEEIKPSKVEKLGSLILLEDITDAKVLERSKDEFFSIASHELRTPLTAVRGNSAMLMQLYGDQVDDKDFKIMLDDIHSASVRLIDIVNDFLDANRLEQGKIRYELTAFNIHDTIQAVATEVKVVAKEKGIKVRVVGKAADTPYIYADKNRVKQIVYNLLGNAMKFTEKGSITIESKVVGMQLCTYITDTGPGISHENQRLLFGKFQQAGNNMLTRETRGTGLGLYISRLLCEQMGGRMALERSEPGKGTTFSFTVPLADAKREDV